MKLETIIRKLEEEAEDANYHSMVSMYQKIADSIVKHGGEAVAAKVMKDILSCGGFID